MNVERAPLKLSKLWPTKLIRRQLAGSDARNLELIALVRADEARERDFTVRYQEQDFFVRPEPPVHWLRGEVEQTVSAYLEHVGVRRVPGWKVEGWYNVNRLGDHHAPHAHPGAYLSGTYYVRVPTGVDESVQAHAGARSACISFHDPRSAANMACGGLGPDARAVHVETPRPGTLMMWPAPLQHYVHPNLTREPRISISFNIILEDW